MKTKRNLFVLATAMIALILMAVGCEKEPLEPLYEPPQVETKTVAEVTKFSALVGGVITNQGTEAILSKGVCFSDSDESPDLESDYLEAGTNDLEFFVLMENLDPGTEYHVRAYATNESETVYGQNVSFTTSDYEKITDIDGNEYRIVQIGDQVWTIDNLKVIHFNDGTPIQNWTEDHYWNPDENPPHEPAYSWYDNDYEQYGSVYGALYNFTAASDPRLAPEGWRVPTYEDGLELLAYLGDPFEAGGKLKITGTQFWAAPNTGATNSSGFSAKGAGVRRKSSSVDPNPGQSSSLHKVGWFWTQTFWGGGGMVMSLYSDKAGFWTGGGCDIVDGLSVRLIKDD